MIQTSATPSSLFETIPPLATWGFAFLTIITLMVCQRGPILRLDPPNLPDSDTRSAEDFETGDPCSSSPEARGCGPSEPSEPFQPLRFRALSWLHHRVAHSLKHPNGFGRSVPDRGTDLVTPPASPALIEHGLSSRNCRYGELTHQHLQDVFDARSHACTAEREVQVRQARHSRLGLTCSGLNTGGGFPPACSKHREQELVAMGMNLKVSAWEGGLHTVLELVPEQRRRVACGPYVNIGLSDLQVGRLVVPNTVVVADKSQRMCAANLKTNVNAVLRVHQQSLRRSIPSRRRLSHELRCGLPEDAAKGAGQLSCERLRVIGQRLENRHAEVSHSPPAGSGSHPDAAESATHSA